jgi:hypothetical protein
MKQADGAGLSGPFFLPNVILAGPTFINLVEPKAGLQTRKIYKLEFICD